jgi:hypothetical protein
MLTPTNRGFKGFKSPTTITECWIDSGDYPNLVAFASDPKYSPYLDKLIIQACSQINKLTNRWWNQQEADEIIIGDKIFLQGGYSTYILKNGPVISVTDLYAQLIDSFSVLSSNYLQVMQDLRTIRVLPNLQLASTSPLPILTSSNTNVWIRYVSGYLKDDIPEDIKLATALYVTYSIVGLKNMMNLTEYSTQTYSQKNAVPTSSPVYQQILELIKPYRLMTIY